MKTQLRQLLRGILFAILLTASHSAFAFFDPTIGTFISRDPIEEDGGQNLYGFVSNDPIQYYDYLGEVCGCCECVERVQLTHVQKYKNKYNADFGHEFDIVVTLKLTPSKGSGIENATLQWNEKVNPPPSWQTQNPGFQPGQWNDMAALFPTSSTFDPWHNRGNSKPADCSGSYTVTIHDIPGDIFGNPRRTLDFRITASSPKSADCPCNNKSITRTAKQVLASDSNGRITTQKFSY